MMAAVMGQRQWSGFCCQHSPELPRIAWTKNCSSLGMSRSFSQRQLSFKSPKLDLNTFPKTFLHGNYVPKREGIHVISPNIMTESLTFEFLRAQDDEYSGVIINPECLPSSANAFASVLRASLSNWKLKGKKGVWLKILQEQADLVPIAIQEGFDYHHAEPGYVMLTYWIPKEPCMLPASPSHQVGIAGFVINDKREILAVKEKCPCNCSGVWKLPTGYINKSEEIFTGAIREIKEETGVNTSFLEMVAFRHAHLVAFEKSDLLFACMLKPLSYEITIDEKEIEAAKWMPLDEFIGQPYYSEDHMSKRVIEICLAAHGRHSSGFTAHRLMSKLDGRLTYLYYNDANSI